MTATNIADAVDGGNAAADAGAALRRLAEAAVGYATAKASHQVDDWTRKLNDFASPEGATERAGYEGVKASLTGKNPVWAATKGAWLGASGKVRVAIVVSLLLLAVLSPVALLLLILGLLVAGIVAGVRAAAH